MSKIHTINGQPGVYNASAPTLQDGDGGALQLDSSGNLLISGSISVGGTTDEAAWTAGSSSFTPVGGAYNDSATALTSGQEGTDRSTPNRAKHVNLRNNAGTEIGTTTTPLVTGGAVASGATDSGNPTKVAGKYNSSPITLTDGQRGDLQLDANGYLNVDVKAGGSSTAQGTYNTSLPTISNGAVNSVQLDVNGRLLASGIYYAPASSTATWTTATTLNTTLAQTCTGHGTATVSTIETGTTTTAGALTFEVFDGTNWWALQGQQIGSFTVQSSYTLVNGTNVAWQFDIAGFQQFRVRLSTAITGTGSPQVVVILQLQSTANDGTPTVGWAQKLDNVNDSITSYPFGNSYLNVTAGQATTTIKSGAGVLHAIIFNTAAAATGTMVLYDNTAASGTKIGAAYTATGVVAPETIILDIAFSTGLTVITATANSSDMTFSYR